MNIDEVAKAIRSALDRNSESFMGAMKKYEDYSESHRSLIAYSIELGIISASLREQEEFQGNKEFVINFGSTGFHLSPMTIAPLLLRRVTKTGDAKDSAVWLARLLRRKEADGKLIWAIWGIVSSAPINFVTGVSLVPFGDVPDSSQKRSVVEACNGEQSNIFFLMPLEVPTAALIVDAHLDPLIYAFDRSRPRPFTRPKHFEHLEQVRLALSSLGPSCVTMAASWFQFIEEDLKDVHLSAAINTQLDLFSVFFSRKIDVSQHKTKEVVDAILKLSRPSSDRLEIALQRLDRALRHRDASDKAMDLAIAFESLLTDGQIGENTFKIALRAALLFTKDNDERIRARSLVGALYHLRNKVVHNGSPPDEITVSGMGKLPIAQVADESAGVLTSIIHTIAHRGSIPTWQRFDLQVTMD